jgi:hypothetical protein
MKFNNHLKLQILQRKYAMIFLRNKDMLGVDKTKFDFGFSQWFAIQKWQNKCLHAQYEKG